MDPRHADRIKIVQNLFASTFTVEDGSNLPQKDATTEAIIQNLDKIDALITKHAPRYPLNRIAKTDLSILRLSVYELAINPSQPTKVVINEAVELAKDLGSDRSYAFINAVLGSILNELQMKKD